MSCLRVTSGSTWTSVSVLPTLLRAHPVISQGSLPCLQPPHFGLGVPAMFLECSVLNQLLTSVSSKEASPFCSLLCIDPSPLDSKTKERMVVKCTRSCHCPSQPFPLQNVSRGKTRTNSPLRHSPLAPSPLPLLLVLTKTSPSKALHDQAFSSTSPGGTLPP